MIITLINDNRQTIKQGGWLKNTGENLTGPANIHFIIPAAVYFSITNGAVNEPAQVSTLEFPGRAFLLLFRPTVLYFPAGFIAVNALLLSGD